MAINKAGFEIPDGITVDIIAVDMFGRILLIKRGNEPFKNCYALPGGFVDPGETLTEAASRELFEETGLRADPTTMQLLCELSNPNRDSRGRIISLVFVTMVIFNNVVAGDDAEEIAIVDLDIAIDKLPLAFDHREALLEWQLKQ